MSAIEEIREGFASIKSNGAREITSISKEYPAFVIRTGDGYGVAVEADDELEVSEKFNSCRFHTGRLVIDGNIKNYLILSSMFEEFRYEFASLCTEFVEPGENGKNRKAFLLDPYAWWKKWRELMGNTSREQCAYDVIAEMTVLAKKIEEDANVEWAH